MSTMTCHYGEDKFQYRVIYLPEQSLGKIAIHIHPNGNVQVDAPDSAQPADIRQAVRQRARWIMRHLAEIRSRQQDVLPRRYISGESHFYLGKRYMLKVVQSPDSIPCVKLFRGCLTVVTQDKSTDTVKTLLWNWYKTRARNVFERRLETFEDQISWVRKTAPQTKLRTMKRQWGSCSPSGKILLNPHLVKAPRECIDYVILHELCHLREHNHSPRFYRLLSRYQPGWQSVKAKLDNMSDILLNQ